MPSSTAAAGGPMSCVPFARERSGIGLQGDAWQWWDAAEGRYRRGRAPQRNAVLVFQRTSRNRSGHLAVVARIAGQREIRVDHANWASGSARGRIARDQPVLDISARNDWSLVRVWYPPANDWGNTGYPTMGFIYA
ncbi:CHAP domain-containing protein [Humitalea sp. 24SJ18S-53]|uniref:CHAP domain-containing protein n=1 Tax=Humitalea sp. 24SJ18S-53 TaxID=3422307 RepID=UPI003D664FB7